MEFNISVSADLSKVKDLEAFKDCITASGDEFAIKLESLFRPDNSEFSAVVFANIYQLLPFESNTVNDSSQKLNARFVAGSWAIEACDELFAILTIAGAKNIRVLIKDEAGGKVPWAPPEVARYRSSPTFPRQLVPAANRAIKQSDGKYVVQIFWDEQKDRLKNRLEISIKNEILHGTQKVFAKAHNQFEVEFSNGLPHGAYRLFRDGILQLECWYENGVLNGKSFIKNVETGLVIGSANYDKGLIDGPAKFINNQTGELVVSGEYSKGKRHGLFVLPNDNENLELRFADNQATESYPKDLLKRLSGAERHFMFHEIRDYQYPDTLIDMLEGVGWGTVADWEKI